MLVVDLIILAGFALLTWGNWDAVTGPDGPREAGRASVLIGAAGAFLTGFGDHYAQYMRPYRPSFYDLQHPNAYQDGIYTHFVTDADVWITRGTLVAGIVLLFVSGALWYFARQAGATEKPPAS